MESNTHPVYSRNVIEFSAAAVEYGTMIESVHRYTVADFADKAVKILPLLYLKALLLPEMEEEDSVPELAVTEEIYQAVQQSIAVLLGEADGYLETFHPDMPYSDAPVAAFISEDLADVYQDVANFVAVFRRQENEAAMQEAVARCRANFGRYWGRPLLNALKALHAIRYTDQED